MIVPPRKDAVIQKHGNCSGDPNPRDQHIRDIKKHGEKKWKEQTGYHRRSISETAMFRFKTILGRRLSSRNFNSQANEAFIKCDILNKMPVPAALKFLNQDVIGILFAFFTFMQQGHCISEV